jgi:hypothetical protein
MQLHFSKKIQAKSPALLQPNKFGAMYCLRRIYSDKTTKDSSQVLLRGCSFKHLSE